MTRPEHDALVEKIAQCIWEGLHDGDEKCARAILSLVREALRTPSEAMVEAGFRGWEKVMWPDSDPRLTLANARQKKALAASFNAMLDVSALVPGDGE